MQSNQVHLSTAAAMALAFVAGNAVASNLYVCASGQNPDDTYYDLATNDLQGAINVSVNGDTVWIEDGFVWDKGSVPYDRFGPARIEITKNITVRSVSGDPSGGAVIRGAFHTAETPVGENALRCVNMRHASATLYGLRLEGGATTTTGWGKGYGGGAVGYGALTNCLVTGCQAGSGGGVMDLDGTLFVRDCTISNNIAGTGGGTYGCSVYGSRIVRNHGTGDSGGIRSSRCWDTLIADNVSDAGNGAGNMYGGSLENCVIRGNEAKNGNVGGISVSNTATVRNCLIADNVSSKASGGVALAAGHVLENCVVSNNWCKGETGGGVSGGIVLGGVIIDNIAYKGGAGVAEAVVSNAVICGNSVEISYWQGGGVYKCSCDNCVIWGNSSPNAGGAYLGDGNVLTRCTVTGNVATASSGNNTGNGGGVCGTKNARIESCLIAGNLALRSGGGVEGAVPIAGSVISNNVAVLQGGGASGVVATRCVIVDNLSSNTAYLTGIGGGLASAVATNCTLVGNWAQGYDAAQADGFSRDLVVGVGGGAYKSTLVSCVVSNSVSTGRGAGVYDCTTYNTVVACNTNRFNSGGGAWVGTHYNTLFTGNVAPSEAGVGAYDVGRNPASSGTVRLYNCTVAGNRATTATSRGGCSGTAAYNTVVSDNVGTGKDEFYLATNSCFQAGATVYAGGDNALFGTGGRYSTAKLGTSEDGKAWTPLNGSPCRNRGERFAWLTDETDVRSRDVYGSPRISGSGVDIGAVEGLSVGLVISIR